jgi:hypothetical protein
VEQRALLQRIFCELYRSRRILVMLPEIGTVLMLYVSIEKSHK